MSEPRAKLTLVDQALAEDHLDAGPKVREALNRYAPSIAKVARKQERASILQALGAQKLEDASDVARITAERDARPTQAEERKHAIGNRWRGRSEGLVLGVALGAVLVYGAFAWSMRETMDGAAEYGSRMVVSGAALQSANPPRACIPGETLEDGRRCPYTTDTRAEPGDAP